MSFHTCIFDTQPFYCFLHATPRLGFTLNLAAFFQLSNDRYNLRLSTGVALQLSLWRVQANSLLMNMF